MQTIPIDALSIIARQCIAVTCLQRFCQRHAIEHPALTAFIEHVWKVAQVESGNFASWERGFAALPVSGMGDPWPEEVSAAIPATLLGTLTELLQHVQETSACTWHGDDLPATRRQLEAVFRLCGRHAVAVPAPGHYAQHDAAIRNGWGPALTDGELRAWRALVQGEAAAAPVHDAADQT
ncbi:hypothetical protein [Janthinobacterium sp. 1_2014MBL_MicDiv]|uniref:hypothetical protein n=1 Tax=Janthinobacterium sp. 1_2014MBL_MicDiv TaxID=1644131 RepID=UPI0008F4FCE3|nr:hypothetical protein [Janthinobacterium sp. 1_2014MBL_MicDiv]APA68647.1 hypothetical protein YQ44_13470 [Janthinobacterium sp. 1_2014MBL_MicDiv]